MKKLLSVFSSLLVPLVLLWPCIIIPVYADSGTTLLETFEGNFVSSPPYGSIPVGWTAADGSSLVNYSQSTVHYEGNYSLRAAVSYDEIYYAILEKTFSGLTPGEKVTLSIKVKCSTPSEAEAFLYVVSGGTNYWEDTNYWYPDAPSDEWRTAELKDIVVPSNGELDIVLGMGNESGTSTCYWDNLILTTGQTPQRNMVASNLFLYVDDGSSGTWMWDGSAWTNLSPADPQDMVASGSLLYADYGSSGTWMYDGSTWTKLSPADPQDMVASGSLLYADYGSSGTWMYDGSTWTKLTPADPQSMVASDSHLYAD